MDIVIYGMGSGGKYIFNEIRNAGSASRVCIKGWIDNYTELTYFNDLPVMKEDEFYEWEEKVDAVLVTIFNRYGSQDVVASLLARGYRSVYVIDRHNVMGKLPVLDENGNFSIHVKTWERIVPVFPRVQYPVVDHCNLNCRGCSSYANIAESHFITCEEFERDIKAMKEKIKKLQMFVFYGGEPILHPELHTLISIFKEYYPSAPVEIISNGIMIPKISDKLIDVMVKWEICFVITQYLPTIKMLPQIVEFLEKNSIDYRIVEPVEQFFRMLTKTEQDEEASYERCKEVFHCKTIRGGKLYPCPTIPLTLERLDYLGIDMAEVEKEGCSFDLYHGSENVWDMLVRLKTSFPMCRFCQADLDKIPWRIGKPEKSDWIRES